MKYWVITNNEDDRIEFHRVESKTMKDAVKQVDGGITVVSSFFKKNYPKYSRLWNKLNKYYNDLDETDFIMWDSAYQVLGHVLGKDDLLWGKNELYIDNPFARLNIGIYDLSDYQFQQLIFVLEEKCKYVL